MAFSRAGDLAHWQRWDSQSGTHGQARYNPPVTLCIVTHNSADVLEQFEAAILALDYDLSALSFQIVDNGSSDETRAWLSAFKSGCAETFAGISIVHQDNLGYANGQNRAVDGAQTDLILICNPDAELAPDSLREAVCQARRDPDEIAAWEFSQTPYEHPKYYDPVTLETSWNSHACVLMRRAAFLKAGGYDEALFLYGEDTELSYRLRAKGYRLRYLPRARIWHDALAQTGRRDEQAFRSLAANILLRRRYGSWIDRIMGFVLLRLALRRTDHETLHQASALIKAKKAHFKPARRKGVYFPFNGVFFERRRAGSHYAAREPLPRETMPRVSVITRSHKSCAALDHAIASVTHQTYPNIEHIIVEDGYVGPSRHDGPTYINTGGVGRSEAGNLGAKAALGEWLLWLDYDDLLFADHVETLISEVLRRRADDPAILAAYSLSWESAGRMENGAITPLTLNPQARSAPVVHAADLRAANPFAIQSVIFHRSLLIENGGFDPALDLLEDWDLWQRFAAKTRFVGTLKTTSIFFTPHSLGARIARQFGFRMAEIKQMRARR